jgi:hypothetical protein
LQRSGAASSCLLPAGSCATFANNDGNESEDLLVRETHCGRKAGSLMCFSPCFVHATQHAFVPQRLLVCQSCGSQAFHVLDCCHSPNYVPVQNPYLRRRLASWMERLQAVLRAWRARPPQDVWGSAAVEALDGREAPPLEPVDVTLPSPVDEVESEVAAESDIYETAAPSR